MTETSQAIRFVPTADVQVRVLSAAITYIEGARLVKLGLYNQDDITGSVGRMLPNGEVSTTNIPDGFQCCKLTSVTLPSDGVTLTAGTPYWLVASADDRNGPSFHGTWQESNIGVNAYLQSGFAWTALGTRWPAAQIRGTRLVSNSYNTTKSDQSDANSAARNGSNIIFSSLDHSPDPSYLSTEGVPIFGNAVSSEPEIWEAVPFTPIESVHVKTLAAAVTYVSGTKLINLSIYSNDAGVPGTVLSNAQSSTSDIPNFGDCCELAKVTFPGAGVALIGGTQYWLVASTDDINAPDFSGKWQLTPLDLTAFKKPELQEKWTNGIGGWLAAEIRGTNP